MYFRHDQEASEQINEYVSGVNRENCRQRCDFQPVSGGFFEVPKNEQKKGRQFRTGFRQDSRLPGVNYETIEGTAG